VIGAASWGVGQTVGALFRVGQGPSHNWCYLETGKLYRNKQICAGTYAGDDGLRWKTYGNTYQGSNESKVFSAGQKQNEFFQVSFWNQSNVCVKTFHRVYYRDTFYVSTRDHKTLIIVYCKGAYNPDGPGTVQRMSFDN